MFQLSGKTISVIFLLLFIFLAWFGFKYFNKYEILNLDSKGTSVVAFGDSLIEGVGAGNDENFIAILSEKLSTPIINLGKSDDTTLSALSRLDSIFEYDPKIVIVLLGGNDYLKKIPTVETFKNLEVIVKTIQSRGAAVLLLGVRGGLLYDSYNDKFADFAKKNKVGFVPNVLDGLIGNAKLMSDAIHPNPLGYTKIADKVYPALRMMIDKKVN